MVDPVRKLVRGSNARPSRAVASTFAFVCVSVACNQLFDIDAPIRAGSEAGAGGGAASGDSLAGVGGFGSGGVGQGGAGNGGGTGGDASGGDAGGPDTGGQGGSPGGGTSGRGGSSAGSGGTTSGASGTGGSGTGGVAGSPNGGMGGTSGDAGASATSGSGGVMDPCASPSLRGGEMVQIFAGTARIGTEDGDLPNTQPVHEVDFDEFCLDKTEVTVAAFRECVDDSDSCEAPDQTAGPSCNWIDMGRDDHPVTCVDWDRAATFCEWAGKRLPTEKEWEYAARGGVGRLYPWGDDAPSSVRLNYFTNVGETTPVGSYPQGATPDTGLLDMAGNVWEWTNSEWTNDYEVGTPIMAGTRIARGGSFASNLDDYVRPSWRDPDNAGDDRFGFRCAYGDGQQ